jgi:hypothetical protein
MSNVVVWNHVIELSFKWLAKTMIAIPGVKLKGILQKERRVHVRASRQYAYNRHRTETIARAHHDNLHTGRILVVYVAAWEARVAPSWNSSRASTSE